jgi:hypothetical protein
LLAPQGRPRGPAGPVGGPRHGREGLLDLYRARQERAAQAGVGAPEGEGVLCPYKGLARFEKQDAEIFHGREALVATLIARLADTPLVAVAGPSGAGKSSLVRAGLLPALAAGALPGSEKWPQHVLSPGAAPRHELAPVLYGRPAPATAAVVVVDQFEELFTACGDEGERAGFVASFSGPSPGFPTAVTWRGRARTTWDRATSTSRWRPASRTARSWSGR